jgi:hypothetical protein
MKSLFPQGPVDAQVDMSLISQLEAEMQAADAIFQPSNAWEIDTEADAPEDSGDIEHMMPMWVGRSALKVASAEDLETFEAFYLSVGPEAGFRRILNSPNPGDIRKFELGTLHDLILLDKFTNLSETTPEDRPVYLEIGIGFGRLPEGVMHLSNFNARCILVDIVPASLAWTHAYLSKKYPDLNVAILDIHADISQFDSVDVLIVPAWKLESISDKVSADILVTIAALQEMKDDQVEFYKQIIEELTKPGSALFFCVSRDFVYPRAYVFPPHWRREFLRSTPRSFSPDFPSEIFRRTDEDNSAHNKVFEDEYSVEVMARYRNDFRGLSVNFMKTRAQSKSRIIAMKQRMDKLASDKSKIKGILEDRMYLVEKGKAAQADLRDARNTLSKVGKENRALEQVNKRAEFERAKLAEFRQREQSLKDKVATLNADIHQARKALAEAKVAHSQHLKTQDRLAFTETKLSEALEHQANTEESLAAANAKIMEAEARAEQQLKDIEAELQTAKDAVKVQKISLKKLVAKAETKTEKVLELKAREAAIKEKLSASVAKAAETRLLMDQKLKAVYVRAEKRQEALEAQIAELREREGELKALVHYEKQAGD